MKVAILSDVHDCTNNLLAALCMAAELDCRHLLYLGDIVELDTFMLLVDEWVHPIDIVFGNNEIDRRSFYSAAQSNHLVTHHGDEGILSLDGRSLYITHYPWAALKAAESGKYDAVFYGHTHVADMQKTVHTLLVNPGEVGGVRRPPSFAIYDTEDNSVRFIRI